MSDDGIWTESDSGLEADTDSTSDFEEGVLEDIFDRRYLENIFSTDTFKKANRLIKPKAVHQKHNL